MSVVTDLDLPVLDYTDRTLVGARFHEVMNAFRRLRPHLRDTGRMHTAAHPSGTVRGIYLAPVESAPVHAVDEAVAVAGVGLEGDRGADGPRAPDEQLTLVEREAIEAANAEHGLTLGLGDTRRNILTEGVSLNDLVGREFTVGPVRARGIELCEPCAHLQQLTGQPVLKALVHRGGLRAEILEGGVIRPGDAVTPL